ncbi:MAG: hypothetical protein K2Y37_03610 [Pirellulales bacterium]|nr:hypothetical protein [Pirellulales bacterium]
MNAQQAAALPARNPFAASRLAPGQIAYLFPPGDDLPALVSRLEQFGGQGQIVGPHGSGKSTLLAMLAADLRAAGHRVALIELHDGQRRLPAGWVAETSGNKRRVIESNTTDVHDGAVCRSRLPDTLVFVDGYEQLGWLARWQLKRRRRRCGWGLVVTSHEPAGWPTLALTRVDRDVAQAVVAALASGFPLRPSADDVAAAFGRCGGDLREMLFDLYDRYEARQRNSAS